MKPAKPCHSANQHRSTSTQSQKLCIIVLLSTGKKSRIPRPQTELSNSNTRNHHHHHCRYKHTAYTQPPNPPPSSPILSLPSRPALPLQLSSHPSWPQPPSKARSTRSHHTTGGLPRQYRTSICCRISSTRMVTTTRLSRSCSGSWNTYTCRRNTSRMSRGSCWPFYRKRRDGFFRDLLRSSAVCFALPEIAKDS